MNKKIKRLCLSVSSAAALAVLTMPSYGQQIIPGGSGWADSYSVDNKCYCDTSYDHGIGDYTISTPAGVKTVREVCEAIGPGPGRGSNPIYNTVQCGHDPAHDDTGNFSYTDGTRRNVADEIECPGRVDLGPDGCDEIGPTWDLDSVFRGVQPTSLSLPGRVEAEDSTSQYGTRTQDTNDGGGGESVGHIEPGDNLSYLVDVETSGKYEVEFRVASPRSNTVMSLSVNGSSVVDFDIPNTGGWENWTTMTEEVFLNSGSQTIRFDFSGVNGGLMNINWFDAEQIESGAVELSNTNWRLSSFNNGEDVYSAIDGDVGSRWTTRQSQRYGQELIIDLNETRSFDRIILDSAGSNNDQPRGYSVYVSDIEGRWGLSVASGEGDSSGVTTIDFSDQNARFIRILQSGSDSYHWWSIHELSIYANSDTDTHDKCGFSLAETEQQANLPAISISNLEPNEVIPHQMVMFVGNTASAVDTVTVIHGESTTEAPSVGVDFKAFAILEPGLNYVGLKAEGHRPTCFPISFDEPENEYEIRYYSYTAVDSQDDVFMYTPANAHLNNVYSCLDDDPCDKQTIADRMRFMALINQMLFAETIVASGGTRKTFTLARDENGDVLDPLFISDKTAEEMVQIVDDSGESRGSYVMMTQVAGPEIDARNLSLGLPISKIKTVMIFRDVLAGAWGGGRRASLGAGTFNTWAADIPEFYERLYDLRNPLEHGPLWTNTNINERTVSRSYTLNIGALMHEIGHALGMSHPIAPQTCAMMGGGGGGSARMDQMLLAGIVPTNICWTTDNNHEPSVNHFEHVLASPWIKGPGE